MLNFSNFTMEKTPSNWSIMSETNHIIAGSILSTESLCGIMLYLLVVYVLLTHNFHTEHPSYMIMISMAVSEVLLLLFFFFMGLMMITQSDFLPMEARP